jgi:hypothetical protein
MWNPAGNSELFYLTSDGDMMAATIAFDPVLSVKDERKLFDGPVPPPGGSGRLYDVSPKDGRFVIARRISDPVSETRLSLIVNWTAQFGKD